MHYKLRKNMHRHPRKCTDMQIWQEHVFLSFLSNMEDLTWKMWQDYRNYTFFSLQTLS